MTTSPFPVTNTEKTDSQSILRDYNFIQQFGATSNLSLSYDDVVASAARVNQSTQTTPPVPLFLPVPYDPGQPEGAATYKQLSDNGILPIFIAAVRYLEGYRDNVQTGPNLLGLAAKTLVTPRLASVTASNGTQFLTFTSVGNLPHSSGTGVQGVPIDNNPEAAYVEIRNASTNALLTVSAGIHTGERIFGLTRAGGSTSPDSVEIEFRSRPVGASVQSSSAYTWELAQPVVLNIHYGYRQRLDQLDETAFRRIFG